ncbi:MAG: SDR family NAD(P)-dependent oxidoreductase [Burkholderiaceae bacterium]
MTSEQLSLRGKVALVTGSTRGIGLASAKGLAAMGAEVIIHGRAANDTEKAVTSIRTKTPKADLRTVNADLASAAGCDALIEQVPAVDILVNNVGIYTPKPFFEITDDDWQTMMDVNVMSGVRLTRHYLKGMLDANTWGRVVFISSESGVVVPKEMVHYGFSKSAQLVIARGAAETTRGTQVTVNSVLPGPTWVEDMQARLEKRATEQNTTVDELKKRTFSERRPSSLIQRYATPEEVANLVCYVCSPASSATNGAALRVDGGVVANPF